MNKQIILPLDWPVQVNNLQATAFLNWKNKKYNKKYRLPTQDQYYALRQLLTVDNHNWQQKQAGNINMQVWNSPCPVNLFETNGFYDIIGNVWQHTCTPLYPFKNFQIHQIYQDYTIPFMDGKHYQIKGGSFGTIGSYSMKNARDFFRRHFHQSCGFRYVQSSVQPECYTVLLNQCDGKVEDFMRIHFKQKQSYIHKIISILKQYCVNKQQDKITTKFLNVGCSVGMIVLQMSKYYSNTYGIDFNARFFQMISRLIQQQQLQCGDIKVSLEEIGAIKDNIYLYQMNPENLDTNKINKFKIVVVDGLTIRQNTLKNVIIKLLDIMVQNSYLLVVNYEKNCNCITIAQLNQIVGKNIVLVSSCMAAIRQNEDEKVSLNLYAIQIPSVQKM